MSESVLLIAAHPDDEVLGAGATLAKLSREGYETHVLILTDGAGGRYEDSMQEVLKDQARKSGAALGLTSIDFGPFPNQKLELVSLSEISARIEESISKIRPSIVFSHHRGDLNLDHKISALATITATRPMKGSPVKSLLFYEVPSSSEWSFDPAYPFRPSRFIDVKTSLDLKLQAMECYQSELRDFPHPRSLKALKILSQAHGIRVGFSCAEAFEVAFDTRSDF